MRVLSIFGIPWFSKVIESSLIASESSDWCVDLICDDDWPSLSKLQKLLKMVKSIRSCDAFMVNFVTPSSLSYMRFASMLGKPVIAYWIGTDVYNQQMGIDKNIIRSVGRVSDLILSYGDNLHGELRLLGLESENIVIPSEINTSVANMPERHAVLLSVADGREEFYHYSEMIRLVRDNPDVSFVVIRNTKADLFCEDNIDFRGVVPREKMCELYDSVSIVIRWPEHDSESVVSMEALIKGKRVISRFPFPRAWIAPDYEMLNNSLREALKEPLKAHLEDRLFALERYDHAASGSRLAALLDDLISGRPA